MSGESSTMSQSHILPEQDREHPKGLQDAISEVSNVDQAIPYYALLDSLREDELIQLPKTAEDKAREPRSYVSFGDEGTTASVAADGNLMQITRYLGIGSSGVFSVDIPLVPEPYFVSYRAQMLANIGNVGAPGLGTVEDGTYPEPSSSLKFELVHNRWPLFTIDCDPLTCKCFYVAFEDTIFQQSQYSINESPSKFLEDVVIHIPTDLRIRDLDFIDPSFKFNEEDLSSDNYSGFLTENKCGFVLQHMGVKMHEKSQQQDVSYESVALAICVFVNGQLQELERDSDNRYRVKPGVKLVVEPSKPLQVTGAFKLFACRNKWKEEDFPIAKDHLRRMHEMLETSLFQKLELSEDSHMGFIAMRNLEHILSVCSIPVPQICRHKSLSHENPQESLTNQDSQPPGQFQSPSELQHALDIEECQNCQDRKLGTNDKAIVLTCGDLSGHRIVTSASFFAFQFLISMYNHLQKFREKSDSHPTPCACDSEKRVACSWEFSGRLQNRIWEVCKRHINWIQHAQMVDSGFGNNHWASGQLIPDETVAEWCRNNPLTSTPFQLIKLAEFRKTFDKGHQECPNTLIEDMVEPWIKAMDMSNWRGFYAFSRPIGLSAELQEFRLEDHVWIWRALKSAEHLGLGKQLGNLEDQARGPNLHKKSTNLAERLEKPQLAFKYTSKAFQQHVLRRFTTENPVSKQTMLAVARSPSDNRFYLHSRDTALFYKEVSSFFSELPNLWQATIEAQKYHDENHDSKWDSPLRYALAFMLGRNECQINDRTPREISDTAKDVLLRSSSASGLFPGALHKETKEPEPLQKRTFRDFYLHRTFEIPYILWEFSSYSHSSDYVSASPTDNKRIMGPAQKTTGIVAPSSAPLLMKKSMPFNNLIVQKSIVDLSDEWLYRFPSFLNFKPNDNKDDEEKLNKDKDETPRGLIIDIPRSRHSKEDKRMVYDIESFKGRALYQLNNVEIYEKLKAQRTAKDSKKRLVWSPNASKQTAELCHLTSPADEQDMVKLFFERHEERVKYFSDQVAATANSWITEFHLSFYRLFIGEENKNVKDLAFLGEKGSMKRAGTCFRFVGDLFDRYWTCHFLESEELVDNEAEAEYRGSQEFKEFENFIAEPKYDTIREDATKRFVKAMGFMEFLNSSKLLGGIEQQKQSWRQRKVLELLLLDRMLKRITKSYKEMIEETSMWLSNRFLRADSPGVIPKDVISVSNALFSAPMKSDAYLEFSKAWPSFQYTLQVMEEDLKEILIKIELWRGREAARQPEEPRWTRNDERRYRAAITKLAASNNHEIRELSRYAAIINSLRKSLMSSLESTRNELSFQSAENVRFFTYITVIFLPLGFATGIFSMSESPPTGGTLKRMVVTAIVTFMLTIVLLLNVQDLEKSVLQPTVKGFGFLNRSISKIWTDRIKVFNKNSETSPPKPCNRTRRPRAFFETIKGSK